MRKWLFLPIVFLPLLVSLPANSQEAHLIEAGSAPILARSAFAHGYRHGYEQGYHLGNVDANMGRQAQMKKVHGANMAYASQFGSRQSFEEGFRAGLKAGYHDGYAGCEFRAVNSVRSLATNLEAAFQAGDPSGDFDHGLRAGYREGFVQSESSPSLPSTLDFVSVNCSSPRKGAFCEGYRRGFVLGQVDALTLRREYRLEASK